MPLYEFQCKKCGARDEVFTRSVNAEVKAPKCPAAEKGERGHTMQRIVSKFARHLTLADQIVEAEAKYGAEVDASMGPSPDIGKYARRYDDLAKNLPSTKDM